MITRGRMKLLFVGIFVVTLISACIAVNAFGVGLNKDWSTKDSGSSSSAESSKTSSTEASSAVPSEVSSEFPSSENDSSMEEPSSAPSSSIVSSEAVSSETPQVSPWEQRQVIISQLNPFDFKAEAARNMNLNGLEYSDILRKINQYTGQKVAFHGVVSALKRDQVTSTGLLTCSSPDYDENFTISFSYDGFPDFIQGDSIYIYGVITGTSQYYTTGGQVQETFDVDAYFYDADTSSENQPLTPEEQKYYYGNYTVYEEGKLFPLKIDASTINGHPYQAVDIYKTPDSIFIQLEFTEWPDAYKGKILNGITDDGLDMITLKLDGSIYAYIHNPSNPDVHCYGTGWNVKYGEPAWASQEEQKNSEQPAG